MSSNSPESKAGLHESAVEAAAADPDHHLPDPKETDEHVQPHEAEQSGQVQPVNAPDPHLPDPKETDVNVQQPHEAEQSGDVQPVNGLDRHVPDPKEADVQAEQTDQVPPFYAEASNSTQGGDASIALSGVGSQAVQSNVDTERDPKMPGEGPINTRETLNGLKDGDSDGTDGREAADIPHRESNLKQVRQSDAVMKLINSVTGLDEEGRSRQRILTFAAKRYAAALEKNPEDYDALYNWALVLQESADNVNPESSSPSKDALLEEACRKYEEATCLCPALNDAFYNWAIAISDRAKLGGRTKEAEELWNQATKNYEKAVQLNWNSPQALNNWGLALQELSSIVPARDKQAIVKTAIGKFRAAIRLQYDFHRAVYNLGTVLYGLAEDISRTGGHMKEVSPDELYSQSAIYIAVAHALKPNYSVYTSALKLVRSMLPLPYLKAGNLAAPPVGNPIAPHSKWRRTHFVLNHERLQESNKGRRQFSSHSGDVNDEAAIRVDIQDIVSVSACADLTLPTGAGLCVDTIHGSVFLVAESWESLDGWLDAIRLVYTIFSRGRIDVLSSIITA